MENSTKFGHVTVYHFKGEKAEINWQAIGSVSPAKAKEFAASLTLAIELATKINKSL